MDSDSDVPLSDLASMDYLRREIVTFERLIAEKTGSCAAVGAVTGHGRTSVGHSAGSGYR